METVDLICGGFPCQPVSVAGKRQAQSDSRWLWPEFARVVDAVRPKYLLVENVPGLLTTAGSEVIADFAKMGYNAEWGCISAAVFGAPYRRQRLFILATNIDGTRIWSQSVEEYQCRHSTFNSIDCENGFYTDGNRCKSRSELYSKSQQSTFKTPYRNNVERRAPFVFTGTGWWATEPTVGRVVSRIPNRVDRIRGLGNAVIPQVAEYLGTLIFEHATNQSIPAV
jgi:DNA (cytosine-5)-methyltransferase 1